MAGTTTYVLHRHSQSVPPGGVAFSSTTPKYLVLMVLDGARPDYFGLTPLPHVDALREEGTEYTKAITGVLESETPTGHTTIATGATPAQNGILGFDWGQSDGSRYSLFDPSQMGTVEQLIQDSHAPTLAGLYKAHYPGSTAVALSGHKYYAAAPLGGPSADAIMYYEGDPKGRYVPVAVPGHTPPAAVLNAPGLVYPSIHLADGAEDTLATKLALSAIGTMHPRLLMINYPEFDWPLGHVYGGNVAPAKVITDMKGFDADLGAIEDAYRKAGILDQTLFVITADHGMMPVTRFIPSTVVTNAISQAGTTSPDTASSTADYIWLADTTKAQDVAQRIETANDPGIQSTYYLSTSGSPHYVRAGPATLDTGTDAANLYLLSTLINGHEPAVVSFARSGATFSDPKTGWKADHGGSSWQSQHLPLILAGPGIRSGVRITDPAQLEDVAPTVLTDMGVAPTGMHGHVLADALEQSSSTDSQDRAAEINQMSPLVNALIAQDSRELKP